MKNRSILILMLGLTCLIHACGGGNASDLKDRNREELKAAIRCVLQRKTCISPGIAGCVLEGYLDGRKNLNTV